MFAWHKNAICLTTVILSSVSQATAQADGDQRLALGPISAVHLSEADSNRGGHFIDDCDNDFDGAIIGGLIGGSPAILALVLAGNDNTGGEKYITLAYVGFLGGIAGFIIGLGVDSARCNGIDLSEPSVATDHDDEMQKAVVPGEDPVMDRLQRD